MRPVELRVDHGESVDCMSLRNIHSHWFNVETAERKSASYARSKFFERSSYQDRLLLQGNDSVLRKRPSG